MSSNLTPRNFLRVSLKAPKKLFASTATMAEGLRRFAQVELEKSAQVRVLLVASTSLEFFVKPPKKQLKMFCFFIALLPMCNRVFFIFMEFNLGNLGHVGHLGS